MLVEAQPDQPCREVDYGTLPQTRGDRESIAGARGIGQFILFYGQYPCPTRSFSPFFQRECASMGLGLGLGMGMGMGARGWGIGIGLRRTGPPHRMRQRPKLLPRAPPFPQCVGNFICFDDLVVVVVVVPCGRRGPEARDKLAVRYGLSREQLVDAFGSARDDWIETDFQGWLGANTFYEVRFCDFSLAAGGLYLRGLFWFWFLLGGGDMEISRGRA